MYQAFRIIELGGIMSFIEREFEKFNYYKELGKHKFENDEKEYRYLIENFYSGSNNQMLDGSKIMEKWFPQVKSHIFISHSHHDLDFIYALVGFLKEELKIDVFIDSTIWGYADELLSLIDIDHCYNDESKTFNYDKRNITTSNVYLMLLNSLLAMIDKSECIIFIETPNSVRSFQEQSISKTYSPWIFSELNIIEAIRKKIPNRKIGKLISMDIQKLVELNRDIEFEYDITEQLNKLGVIDLETIINWIRETGQNSEKSVGDNLDNLYRMMEVE